MIKKILPFILLLLLFSCENRKELIVLTDHSFPPFEYIKNGEPVGVDPEIATIIGEKLGKKVKILPIGFSSIIPSIERKLGDIGIAAITITPERQKCVDFSIPYAKSEQFIISLNRFPITNKNELDGIRVGVKQGTTSHATIRQIGLKKMDLYTFSTAMHIVRALLNEEIDAAVIDQQTAVWITTQYDQTQSHPLEGTAEYYAICVQKNNTKLLMEINKTLEELISQGKIEALIKKHSNFF